MKTLKVTITTTEELLGTASGNPDIHSDFIASKAPSDDLMGEEVAAVSAEEMERKAMTVFPRHNGEPIMYDYQIKGFFKDTCSALRRVHGSKSSKLKAFKKEIDGLIFVGPRHIPIQYEGEMSTCQRPLRASTLQGERITLASSEAIPAGATMTFKVVCLSDDLADLVKDWLEYGKLRGLGQWRNSGKGRFKAVISEESEE